jgi:hypothetical protein
MMSTTTYTGTTVTIRQSCGVFAPERGGCVMTQLVLLIFHFIYHVCIITDQSLTGTPSCSILTLRSIAQPYCSQISIVLYI